MLKKKNWRVRYYSAFIFDDWAVAVRRANEQTEQLRIDRPAKKNTQNTIN